MVLTNRYVVIHLVHFFEHSGVLSMPLFYALTADLHVASVIMHYWSDPANAKPYDG